MKGTDYAYAVARIRANESKLLSSAMLDEVVAAASYDKAVDVLRARDWVRTDDTDVSALIAAQSEALWVLMRESVTDKNALAVLTALNDFYNVKAALKSMLTDADPAPYYVQPIDLLHEYMSREGRADNFLYSIYKYDNIIPATVPAKCM